MTRVLRAVMPAMVALALVGFSEGRASADTVGSGGPIAASHEEPDRFDLWVRGETHAALFRRALLPGGNGAIVATDTVVPIREYVLLRARDVDTAWAKDSLDAELSAWGDVTAGSLGGERSVDGDMQTANVGYRQGPLSLRIGRQHVAGGAARYARFDGASAEADLALGLNLQVYGGLTVLPRWNEQPGYHYLGAAVDSDLRNPRALPPTDRGSHTLVGGRVGYRFRCVSGAVSVHDQWEHGGLARLDVGADARAELSQGANLGGNAVLDLDARRFADARLFLDVTVVRPLDVSLEYLHTEPALLLSRQSVLAVFSTDGYDEIGGTALARAAQLLSVEGSAFAEVYDSGRPGARAELAVHAFADRSRTTALRVGYTRVEAPTNGYHSVRTSVVDTLAPRVSGTLEAYGYFYDEAISSVRTSLVYAGTLTMRPLDALGVLFGASVARSPYAAVDAQTYVRLSYDVDLAPRRRVR